MAKKAVFNPDSLDATPISVFDLPQSVLASLVPLSENESKWATDDVATLYNKQEQLNQAALERLNLQQQKEDEGKDNSDGGLSCGTCQQTFADRLEQREHFGTDWHRYNIKRKLVFGQTPVSSTEFDDMLADLSSLSGSESEQDISDEDDDNDMNRVRSKINNELGTIDEQDKVATLVGKQQTLLDEAQEIEKQVAETKNQWLAAGKSRLEQKYTALSWFSVPTLTKTPFHLGIYRMLLESRKTATGALNAVEQIQQSHNPKRSSPRIWTILMMGGGHFAGAIIDVNQSKGMAEQQLDKQVNILTHKTFHRYTTRRKQGGSQSANDNGKGKANSAGAQIRRYNEMALKQDIRELLNQWKKYIDESEFVMVHAPSENKKIIYGYDGAVLHKDNAKICNVPFTTRRPTLSELRRVYLELTTLKVIQVDERSLLQHQKQLQDREDRLRQRLEKTISKSTEDQKQQQEKTVKDPILDKLLVLVKQGKVNLIQSYLEKHSDLPVIDRLPSSLIEGSVHNGGSSDYGRYPTILHLAASQGHADVVSMLLRDTGSNPTLKNDIGKTAYEVCKDKATRNVFRRCMCDMPDLWSWLDEARVPSPLTLEDEKEQLEKDRKKKAKEDERKRLIELERQQKEDARLAKEEADILEARNRVTSTSRNKKKSAGQMLDPMARALRDNQVNVANMSPEARMRLEREKRARAAEERLKKN